MVDEISTDGEDGALPFPTAAGVAVSAANTAAGKALLSPAAESFGRYFGERAEEITARWRSERRANAERMQKKVTEKEGAAIRRPAPERQAKLLIEWFEASSDVGEGDAELSHLWEGVLSEIYKNNSYSKQLIEAAKHLNADDIIRLKSIEYSVIRWSPGKAPELTKLHNLGLVYRWTVAEAVFYHANLLVGVWFLTIPAMLVAVWLGFDPEAIVVDPKLAKALLAATILFSIATLVFLGTIVYRLATRVKLTLFGRALVRALVRYSADKSA